MQAAHDRFERDRFCNIPTLILEDEPETLENLSARLRKLPHCKVTDTTFYEEAKDMISKGQYMLFVTDLLIEKKANGRKKTDIATKILQKIEHEQLFVPSIATSAYPDYLKEVKKDNLAVFVIEKQRNSEDKISEEVGKLVRELYTRNVTVYDMLINLRNILHTKDLEKVAEYYSEAKKLVNKLNYVEDYVPIDHRKGFWLLRQVVLHLSAIPSPSLGLMKLTEKSYDLIRALANNCLKPSFRYSKDARPIDNDLSLLGYNTRPRLNLEIK